MRLKFSDKRGGENVYRQMSGHLGQADVGYLEQTIAGDAFPTVQSTSTALSIIRLDDGAPDGSGL